MRLLAASLLVVLVPAGCASDRNRNPIVLGLLRGMAYSDVASRVVRARLQSFELEDSLAPDHPTRREVEGRLAAAKAEADQLPDRELWETAYALALVNATIDLELEEAEAASKYTDANPTLQRIRRTLERVREEIPASRRDQVREVRTEIIRQRLDALRADRDRLLEKYSPTHREVVAMDARIARLTELMGR